MNLTKRSALIALTAAMSLVGCDRSGHGPDKNPDNQVLNDKELAGAEGYQTKSEDDSTSSNQAQDTNSAPQEKEQARADDADRSNTEFGPILATPSSQVGGEQQVVQTRPAKAERTDDQQPAEQREERKRGVIGKAGQGLANAGGAIKGTVFGVGAATGYYASEIYHSWRPTQETTGRRDALDSMHEQKTQTRAAAPSDLAALKSKIAQLSPNSSRVKSIINADSDTKRLLTSVLTEENPENVVGASERLVDEVFKVADDANGKVQQIQLGLRSLAMAGSYDAASSARVSYLQTELDKRIASDDLQATLKRGSFIILASAVGGAFGGYNGVDRTANYLHTIPFRRGLAAAEDGVEQAKNPRFWNRMFSRVSNKATEGTDAAADAGNTVKSRTRRAISAANIAIRKPFVRSNPKELALADIRDVLTDASLDAEATIKKLGLTRTYAKSLPDLETLKENERFVATAKPGLQVMSTQRLKSDVVKGKAKAKLTADEYRVVFMIDRPNEKGQHYYQSLPLLNQDADDLVKALNNRAPARELTVVDVSGPTPIRASQADAEEFAKAVVGDAGSPAVVANGTVEIPGAARALPGTGETAGRVAEEKIASGEDLTKLVDDTKAGIEKAQKKVLNKGAAAIEKSNEYFDRSVAAIKGDQPFDVAKAAVVAPLVGVPAYLFSRSAYFQGRRVGEGYDALYLEDLIPNDRLQKVVVQADGSTEDAR